MKPTWMVTRQRYYYRQSADSERDVLAVEISKGTEGWTCDALCKQYTGEFEKFHDPREAVEAARKIRGMWLQDYLKSWVKHAHIIHAYREKAHLILFVQRGILFRDPPEEQLDLLIRPWHAVDSLLELFVTVNSGGIHGMEGEPWTKEELEKWAFGEWAEIENCAYCGEPIDPKEYWSPEFDDDTKCCSQNCFENWQADQPVECCVCGEYTDPRKVIWDSENPFCSQKCLDKKTEEDNGEEEIEEGAA